MIKAEESEKFQIPAGFRRVSGTAENRRAGEETWLIQLPSSLDIKQLSKISTGRAFVIDNAQYELIEESEEDEIKNLKVIEKGEMHKTKISKVFKIVEQASIPEIEASKVIIPKPLVEEKEGLHMRYFPTGYGREETVVEKADASNKKAKEASKSGSSDKSDKTDKKKSKKRKGDDDGDKKEKKKKKKSSKE